MEQTNKTKIKFMRGAVKYAADKLGIALTTAYQRIQSREPKALTYAAEFELKKKQKIQEAMNKYVEARSFNPIPADFEDQLNKLPEDL
jgi:hypothetical protein